eukprot:TRINITY_DN101063_c0_g1_i1.p1 TRINITY_DN101063_c0_g1~~TRINITY_DN101063_c0_g1_i1.p1  ORF type:complete len:830 (+),score=149.60 TRINITY_DN101063_c0_g1_i1:103-2592(+)
MMSEISLNEPLSNGSSGRTGAPVHRRFPGLEPPGSPGSLRSLWRRQLASADEFDDNAGNAVTLARAAGHMGPPPGTESLDFDLHESEQYLDYITSLGTKSRKRKGAVRWLLLIVIGATTAVIAVCIELAVKSIFNARFRLVRMVGEAGSSLVLQYLTYVVFCMALAAVAGWLVCFVEPLAAGSGIPEVKCYLNGVDLPRLVRATTLFAKAPGMMFSVSAGLPCGKEGPMIHSGSVIGAIFARLGSGATLRAYRSDTETRDLVVAGAASGVSAAFGAPLGGVLFALEEGASFMNPSIMVRTFVCSASACFVVRFMMGPLSSPDPGDDHVNWGTMGAAAPLSFGNFPLSDYQAWELLNFLVMGCLGGLCGAFFNNCNTHLTHWRKRHVGGRGPRRFLEVLVVVCVISSVNFFTPIIHGGRSIADVNTFTQEELLFWQPGGDSIKDLFHSETDFAPGLLAFFLFVYYVLACWTYGLGVPSGLFVPSLLSGAAFGRLVGQALKAAEWTDTPPGIYALIGATAFLSGMARITISLAVILMEATGQTVFGLPIFLTVMASKWTGDIFNDGLYDIHIKLKHVPLLETFPEKEMIVMSARDVMNPDVLVTERVEQVEHLLKILQSCEHHAFPVVHNETQRFLGMVKRNTLHEVLYHGRRWSLFQEPEGDLPHYTPCLPWKEVMKRHPNYPSLDEVIEVLKEEDYAKRVDLRPYVNRGGYSVPVHAALTRVYMLFRTLGLRHLPVVSHTGAVCGIITRKDLILKHEEIEHDAEVDDVNNSSHTEGGLNESRHFETVVVTNRMTRRRSTLLGLAPEASGSHASGSRREIVMQDQEGNSM